MHGIAARTFTAVDAEGLSVSTIFRHPQLDRVHGAESQGERASGAGTTFHHEIEQGLIDGVSARANMTVIAVVGDGMAARRASRPASLPRSKRRHQRRNCAGSSSNISCVVAGDDAAEAARRCMPLSAVELAAGGRRSGTRRGAAQFGRVGRALADRSRRAAAATSASSDYSIDPVTSSTRAASAGAGCSIWRARRIEGDCWPRSAASRRQHLKRCR